MFAAFVAKGIVDDIDGYYNPAQRKFYSVVSLGREVCGFPRIVHGGLTAAIIDETFGGLLFALKQSGALSFWGPAYTVSGTCSAVKWADVAAVVRSAAACAA